MGFLRRLFGGAPGDGHATSIQFTVSTEGGRDFHEGMELCVVTVGGVSIPGEVYRDYQRDVQDWSSGVSLHDPRTGRSMRRDDYYPPAFVAAGARSTAVVGLPHHPDSQSEAFAVGQRVRLVPEPTNPANPRAIAVRSGDGRLLAGYISDDELERVREGDPPATEGIVTWENFTWRPRTRIGLRILIGPRVSLAVVPASKARAEFARRQSIYMQGRLAEDAEREREMARRQQEREEAAAAREAARIERETHREAKRRAAAQAAAWKLQGLCVECGATIEPRAGSGRRAVRCVLHRQPEPPSDDRPAGVAKEGDARHDRAAEREDERPYANTTCPYCGAVPDPLPKAKSRCRVCGQAIFVRSAPDGFCYLLQEVDLPVVEAAWVEYHQAKAAEEARSRNAGGAG
jgi:hypothetical protein